MNFTDLPNEIIRKIICYLPQDKFVIGNMINKDIYAMKLNLMLIPWYIENLGAISDNDLPLIHRLTIYKYYISNDNPIVLPYELLEEINKLIGDASKYDKLYKWKEGKKLNYKERFINKILYENSTTKCWNFRIKLNRKLKALIY